MDRWRYDETRPLDDIGFLVGYIGISYLLSVVVHTRDERCTTTPMIQASLSTPLVSASAARFHFDSICRVRHVTARFDG